MSAPQSRLVVRKGVEPFLASLNLHTIDAHIRDSHRHGVRTVHVYHRLPILLLFVEILRLFNNVAKEIILLNIQHSFAMCIFSGLVIIAQKSVVVNDFFVNFLCHLYII